MSRILLQSTIPESPDDWDIISFSLPADELRAAGGADPDARGRDLQRFVRQTGRQAT